MENYIEKQENHDENHFFLKNMVSLLKIKAKESPLRKQCRKLAIFIIIEVESETFYKISAKSREMHQKKLANKQNNKGEFANETRREKIQ